jgi:hypothetical protein
MKCFGAFYLALHELPAPVVIVFGLLWWFGVRMPGENTSSAAPLSADEVKLREELRADVEMLAGLGKLANEVSFGIHNFKRPPSSLRAHLYGQVCSRSAESTSPIPLSR